MQERQWQQIKEIFTAALEQPVAMRAQFLAETCGDDEALRGEVDSLLAAQEEPKNLLEQHAIDLASQLQTDGDKYHGKRFGAYRILREIGRGGMGSVFLAERADGAFQQQVALKIIRRSFADRELEKHFRRERQILASLNHPNIAKLIDGGVSDTGELFLAMEFVAGEPLVEFAENNQLAIDDRLRLFLKICHAVSFAHQSLIIHRDLKPSNILVTEDGAPHLLDFGLAKLAEPATPEGGLLDLTETGFRAFTPAYASPEQILGKRVTTASDVFSLGVILYELLTNEKPFDFEGKSLDEIIKTVTTSEPSLPSRVVDSENPQSATRQRQLRGDLDNITLKALQKDPPRRYQFVAELAGDIERHLVNLPITARPNTVNYRARKFFKRNRASATAGALVVLSLIIGLAIAIWQAKVARHERDRAQKSFQEVRKLSNSLLFEITPRIERLQGSTEAREILVKRGLKYLDSLASESSNDATLQGELASAYETIGDLQGNPNKPNLSDFKGAVASYEKAQYIRQMLLRGNHGDVENRRLLAINFATLGSIRTWTSDFAGSLKDSETALQFYQSLLAEQPRSIELKLALAEAQLGIANTLYLKNQLPEAISYLQNALSSLEELKKQHPENKELLTLLGKALTQLSLALSWSNKQAEGEAEMAKALAITELQVANYPNDSFLKQDLLRTYWESSSLYETVNNQLSFQYLLKALDLATEAVKNDSLNTQAKQNLAKTYSRLGVISNYLKKENDAISYLERSLAIFTDLEKSEPRNLTYKSDMGRAFTYLGLAKFQQQNLQGALAEYQNALDVFEIVVQADVENKTAARNLAVTHQYIADLNLEFAKHLAGRSRQPYLQTAKHHYQKALDILLQLKTEAALPEYDQAFLEKMQAAIQQCSKEIE